MIKTLKMLVLVSFMGLPLKGSTITCGNISAHELPEFSPPLLSTILNVDYIALVKAILLYMVADTNCDSGLSTFSSHI